LSRRIRKISRARSSTGGNLVQAVVVVIQVEHLAAAKHLGNLLVVGFIVADAIAHRSAAGHVVVGDPDQVGGVAFGDEFGRRARGE